MKNRTIIIVVLTTVLFIFSACSAPDDTQSIDQQLENAMHEVEMEFDDILHKEVINEGIFVFYSKNDQLWGGFIKQEDEGWKWVRGGGGAPLIPEEEYSNQGSYYKESNFLIQYGIITEPSIKSIKLEHSERVSKTVTTESGVRLWFLISEGSQIDKVEPVHRDE